MKAETGTEPRAFKPREMVLICLTVWSDVDEALREGCRLAKQLDGRIDILYLSPRHPRLSPRGQADVEAAWGKACDVGASVYEIEAHSIISQIIAFARQHGASMVVLAPPALGRFARMTSRAAVVRMKRELPGAEVVPLESRT